MSWQEYMSYEPLNVKERPAAALAVTVESDIDRVSALLSGIKGGWQQAAGSALARAANAGKTEAKKAVTEQYALSASLSTAQRMSTISTVRQMARSR